MEETLYEIYTDDSGGFSVGTVFCENESDIVFRGVDEEGKISAYFAVPRRQIAGMRKNTAYLEMIRRFMYYAEEHSYSRWFTLPELVLDPRRPLMGQILSLACDTGEIVTVGIADREDDLYGYVEDVSRGRIMLRCVDPLSGTDLAQVQCRIRDMDFLEYGSVFNRLLKYAREDKNVRKI